MGKKKLKVLLVIADGAIGGGSTFVLTLIKYLSNKQNVEYHCVTMPDSYLFYEANAFSKKVYPVNFFGLKNYITSFKRMRKLIAEIQPDIIHANGLRASLPVVTSAFKFNIPVLYNLHGYHQFNQSFFMKYICVFLERYVSSKAKIQVFVSKSDFDEGIRGRAIASPEQKVIWNGVDLKAMPLRPFRKNQKVLGFLGRLEPQKQPGFVIELMSVLKENGFVLKVVGGGSIEAQLYQMQKSLNLVNHISFTGGLARKDALQEIAETDLVLMPSSYEPFGLTAIEAMGMGIPVIASKVGGLAQIINSYKDGILIDSFDKKKWIQAVNELYENDGLYRKLSENAQKSVKKKYTSYIMCESYYKLYIKLLA